jgi:hypothetical protein
MDRRDSIKTLLLGALGSGFIINGCIARPQRTRLQELYNFNEYGRLPSEKARDQRLFKENFFTDHEIETVAVLCDLILPATSSAGSAGDANVPAFIDFIVKDMPYLQDRFRNGIKWMDGYSKQQNGKDFIYTSVADQKKILDAIAYPDTVKEELQEGASFFREIRNLTLTGYYTTEMGYEDLGYVGNRPNIWDGVPDEVLAEHDVDYEDEWIAKCVNQDRREEQAEWDDEGNLLNN